MDADGSFLDELAKTLEETYGVAVDTKDLSVQGRGRELLTENLPQILEERPDILLIRFGMMDHCLPDASSEEALAGFTSEIESAVAALQEHQIDVILMGFAQQNITLDVEDVSSSLLYNDALREIAQRKGVYFADVYNTFSRVGNIKPLSRDVYVDYVSEPANWGQRLYLSSLLEVFNIEDRLRTER